MKTARTPLTMSSMKVAPDVGGAKHKASDEAIDSYSTKVLQRLSEDNVDSNVGPYVTSLLRCADIHDTDELSSMEEYDSLLELLEDQCNMKRDVATEALRTIASAVITRMLPLSELASVNGKRNNNIARLALYTGGESSLDSFQSMREHLPSNGTSAINIEPYTPTGGGAPSPLKPDNLIPSELFGVLDKTSPAATLTTPAASSYQVGQHSQQRIGVGTGTQVFQYNTPPTNRSARPPTIPYTQATIQRYSHAQTQYHHQPYQQHINLSSPPVPKSAALPENNTEDFPPLGKTADDEFPSLGASTSKSKRSRPSGAKTIKIASPGASATSQNSNRKNSTTKKQHGSEISDKELAAALFRPARPRQNSIESEQDGSNSNTQRSRGSSVGSYHAAVPENVDGGAHAAYNMMNDYYFQQQLASCVEILLSMNQELSEEAAMEAALIAQLDYNLAQHIVDSAMSLPPICKYMMQEGSKCFRSDCVFSHDIDSHTCLFWIRGRCGKGNLCKFLHGFDTSGLPTACVKVDADPSIDPIQYGSSYPQHQAGGFPQHAATETSGWNSSFANIAKEGYGKNKFQGTNSTLPTSTRVPPLPTVRIPQDLWNPHENRDAAWFGIADPIERYQKVMTVVSRHDVIDLHFQSLKTFSDVLSVVLPAKLEEIDQVWIVTGTGHHVGSNTHQKGGGALEQAVIRWLSEEGYTFHQGKDRNGLGGALLVKQH